MPEHVVCKVDEIPAGEARRFTIGKRDIAIFNTNGELAAIADRCPHEGASLCRGKISGLVQSDMPGVYRMERDGELVRCPWHGWEFDLRTGQSYCDPKRMKVRTYGVKISPGSELHEGPYKLEIFDVSVRDNYVVVTL